MNVILSCIKFAWRILNFIRDLVMNLVFLVFVLVLLSVATLMIGADKSEKTVLRGDQGALLLNLDGYLADNRDEKNDFKTLLK